MAGRVPGPEKEEVDDGRSFVLPGELSGGVGWCVVADSRDDERLGLMDRSKVAMTDRVGATAELMLVGGADDARRVEGEEGILVAGSGSDEPFPGTRERRGSVAVEVSTARLCKR